LAEGGPAPAGNGWIPIVIACGLTIGVILVNVMSSKRGNRE